MPLFHGVAMVHRYYANLLLMGATAGALLWRGGQEGSGAVYVAVDGRLIGGEDPMATMSHTHREIYKAVQGLERLAAALEAPDLASSALPELQRALYALDTILRLHFAQEEELYHNLAG